MHHDHEHPHTHTHEHDHDHDHCGEHIHCGENHDCANCGQHDPKAELIALMRYMVGHNNQHANELATLAKRLQVLGDSTAYEQVMQAVSDFEKGNLRLSAVLSSLDAG